MNRLAVEASPYRFSPLGTVFAVVLRKARGWMLPCLGLFFSLPAGLGAETSPPKSSDAKALLDRAADLHLHYRERDLAAQRLLALGELSLPPLLRGMEHKRSVIRQLAALMLGELGLIKAEAALLRASLKKDFMTAGNARQALARVYARLSPDELQKRLRANPASIDVTPAGAEEVVVVAALEALAAKAGAPGATALLKESAASLPQLLQAESAAVREAAAAALGFARPPDTVRTLLGRIAKEKEIPVLIAICRSLARLQPSAGLDLLRPLTERREELLALAAAAALYQMGDLDALKTIASLAEGGSQKVRVRALEILGELRNPAAMVPLAKACEDSSWLARRTAVQAMGKFKHPGVTSVVRPLLSDDDPRVRAAAALLLHRLGTTTGVVWVLLDNLRAGSLPYRREAALALGRMQARQAVKDLGGALADADLELACRAAVALGKIGGPSAGTCLLKALPSSREPLAVAARQALAAAFGEAPGGSPEEWRAWAGKRGIPWPKAAIK